MGSRMKRSKVRCAALAPLLALSITAQAETSVAQAGATKSAPCRACHGPNGIATLPDAPNLAGQNPVYVERALKEYRSGTRRNEVMSVTAKNLTDEDIRDLAMYYASIEIVVKTPQ